MDRAALEDWIKDHLALMNEGHDLGFSAFPSQALINQSSSDELPKHDLGPIWSELRSLVKCAPSYWFYMISPDNALTNWVSGAVNDWSRDQFEAQLLAFRSHPSPEGGASQLGLLAFDRSFLLHFTHSIGHELEVEIFGSLKLCDELSAKFRP